uniref:Uncharacterized protein n=1 Tax=Anguilla anguilla TaxID=7936 RepID=A0A0E9XTB6_ANGAN
MGPLLPKTEGPGHIFVRGCSELCHSKPPCAL